MEDYFETFVHIYDEHFSRQYVFLVSGLSGISSMVCQCEVYVTIRNT